MTENNPYRTIIDIAKHCSIAIVGAYICAQFIIYAALPYWKWNSAYLLFGIFVLTNGCEIVKEKKLFLYRTIFISLFLMMPIFIGILANQPLHMEVQYRTIGFSLAVAASFFFLQALLPVNKFRKIFSCIFYSIIFLLFAILCGYYFSSGSLLNASAIMAVFQTNPAEARSYLIDYMPWQGCCVIFLFFTMYIVYLHQWNPLITVEWKDRYHSRYQVIAIVVCVILTIVSLYPSRNNFYKNLFIETQKGLKAYRTFTLSREEHSEAIQNQLIGISSDNPGVYILVIGESQNRLHMSAYGYEKETTPWLNKMKDDKHALLFTDARSCHTHTVPVLSYALTDKNQYNQKDLPNALTLIEVAKAAGFHTVWLSNQVRYGAWDTPTAVIADEADEQVWLNNHMGNTTDTSVFDGDLVGCLKQSQVTTKTLIVIHLMGNHSDYRDRYPHDFSFFDDYSIEGFYDNSIRYNDFVVQSIYETVKTIPNFQGMVYCADHADDVERNLGHDSSHFTQDMTRIPFYMLFSDDYIEHHYNILQELRVHKDSRFTNDLLYNTMLGIMGIIVPADYEEQNDLTNKNYDTDKERFRTLHGKEKLD